MNGLRPMMRSASVVSLMIVLLISLTRAAWSQTPPFTLATSSQGNGTVTPDPGQADYADGSQVNLTALPDAGWLFDHWTGDLSTDDWWDTAWTYRTTIWIDADEYPRTDKVIDAPVNFSQQLAALGQSGPLSVDSLRVLEIDAAGAVIDAAVPFQFDPAPGFDASTNAAGTVVFMAAGPTPANTVRRFHLYFDTAGNFSPATVAAQLSVTDNVMDEGQAAVRVDAPNGSYFFQKDAGGFSSLVDINGNDWIDFHPTGGAAGEYRGVPNPVYPEGSLHPGVTNAASTILHAGPLKATVHTITDDGDWESIWEFYPSHATMTLLQAAHPYWFVYEGTPGGLLEPAIDRVVRSNGAQTTAATSWSGDLVGPEWVYFADPNVDRSLFVAQHEEDDVVDSYFPLQDAMTVMGFGRFGTETRQEHLPYQVSMGLLDGTTFGPTADAIQSAYQPLTVTVGDAVTQGMGTASANPVTLTMDDDKTVTAIFVDSTVVPQYTLSIAAGTGGAVSVTPDKPSYNAGETVTITATADQEYEFANWSGSTVGVGNPVVVTMNADKSVVANFVTGAPVIDLWYGDTQNFGQVGNPQHWINILGNVSDPDGIATFVYTLNGGPDVPLATGPDTRRLDQLGDFNIDIAIADLVNGANQVVIRAVDNENNETITPVTVNYTAGTVWPSPYTIDWSTAAAINDVAQVVDGEWFIGPDGVRTVQSGYDRVVAIGDLNWTDYEITVPMVVHGIDWPRISPHTGPPGLGLLMRWAGHTDDPIAGWQPKTGWMPHGEIAWWNWSNNSSATLVYFSGWPSANSTPAFDTPYIFKMRVESVDGGASRYSTKVWEQGQPEPANWFLERENDSSHLGTGSVMLLAHMVDASFGDVTINPITQSGHTLSVAPNGSGAVTVAPQKPSYEDNETVTLTASADPGWIFTGWSGDLTSSDNPLTLTMTANVQLTANFVQSTSHTLTVNSRGGGSTTRSPNQPTYDTGSTVTLSATADPGWVFTGWSGDVTGTANPVNVTVNANMSVTAEFAYQAAIVSDDFSACSLNTSLWNFSDPVGDGGYSFGNGRLELIVPGGSSHDVWDGANNAVRVMQAAADTDFELEVKFESGVADTYEMQGLLVEEDSGNFLRFDFYGTGANTAIFAARFDAGTPSIIYNGDVAGGNAAPLYMRIRRLGDQWTQFYSVDGQSWTQASSFTRAMTVNAVGIFAANSSNNPAHTAQVDYFFNRATPIAGEDSTIAQPTLTLTTDGTGAIAANPDQPLYTCGDQVTVSATPAAGWAFSGWSGAASGTENPLTIAMDGNKSIQATFTEIVYYTVAATGTGNGSVTAEPSQAQYVSGTSVTVTATPDNGYAFVGWSGDANSSDNPLTLVVDGDKNVVATFAPIAYTLSTSVPRGGTIARDPDWASYDNGTQVTLTAVPDPGYFFDGWNGDIGGSDNPVTITMDGDKIVSANFIYQADLVSDDFSACALDPGVWSFVNPASDGSYSLSNGALNLIVPGGVPHDVWGSSNASVRVMQSMTDSDFELEVKFESGLTTAYAMQGLIIEQDSNNYLRFDFYGSNSTNLFAARFTNAGAFIEYNQAILPGNETPQFMRLRRLGDQWLQSYSVDGQNWTQAAAFTQPMTVTSVGVFAGNAGGLPPHTAVVDYFFNRAAPIVPEDGTPSLPVLTTAVNGAGTVAANPHQSSFVCGEAVVLTATPDAGWLFDGWSGDGTGTENPLTVTMVADRHVIANFVPQTYNLTVNTMGNGGVSASPNQNTFTAGSSVTLTATPDPGWVFAGWSGGASGTENPLTVTMDGDKTITANFQESATVSLLVTASGGGSVTSAPAQSQFLPDSNVTLTATADPGWVFVGWNGDATGMTNPLTVVMDGNKIIVGEFAYHAALTSDDFSTCLLDAGVWSYSDPIGDGHHTVTNGQLELSVPAGTVHDVWTNGNEAVRVMQAISDTDFELEVKFASGVQDHYAIQGLVVEQDPGNFIRFDFFGNTATTDIFAAQFVDGTPSIQVNAPITNAGVAPLYMRVRRLGNQWTQSYSLDGQSWIAAPSFTRALTVNSVGIFAANADVTPAHTAVVDYFFSRAAPIVPEDGTVGTTLTTSTIGNGTITATPDQAVYNCADSVSLTAIADPGWVFIGWNGDITETDNPVVVPMADDLLVTATFQQVTTQNTLLYLSSTTNGVVDGVSFRDEDIVVYDTEGDSWSLFFDGSDVGVISDVDAFDFLADGSLLFSLSGDTTVPGLGSVDDSDIVRFIPTSWGPTTTGSFEFYFDGSDVGLTLSGEDIIAIAALDNGSFLASFIGNPYVPGLSGKDEDLLLFTPTQLGVNTIGTWSLYFDGSDVGFDELYYEDIYATWADEATGALHLAARGVYNVPGLSGDEDDVFVCTPGIFGPATTCSFSLGWDGDLHGFGSEDIDGIAWGAPTAVASRFNSTQPAAATEDVTANGPDETDDDDIDDIDGEQWNIFLPAIMR